MSKTNIVMQMPDAKNYEFEYVPGNKYLILWKMAGDSFDPESGEAFKERLYECYEFLGIDRDDMIILIVDDRVEPLKVIQRVEAAVEEMEKENG